MHKLLKFFKNIGLLAFLLVLILCLNVLNYHSNNKVKYGTNEIYRISESFNNKSISYLTYADRLYEKNKIFKNLNDNISLMYIKHNLSEKEKNLFIKDLENLSKYSENYMNDIENIIAEDIKNETLKDKVYSSEEKIHSKSKDLNKYVKEFINESKTEFKGKNSKSLETYKKIKKTHNEIKKINDESFVYN